MKKILLAPNSFKECSDSIEVANILGDKLGKNQELTIAKLPISDGGDGFLKVCKEYFNLKVLTFSIPAAYAGAEINVPLGYSIVDRVLFIESAEVVGLRCIPKEKRHPLLLNTKGLGELLKLVMVSGINVDKVVIGIGGTGTSDLGLGCCSSFGLKLFDLFGKETDPLPENYFSIKKYEWNNISLPFKIEVIADVDNPLLGENGAVKCFAEQKGATKGEVKVLELGFDKICKLLKNNNMLGSFDHLNGAGGGLAAGLQIFFNAEVIKSKDFIKGILSDKMTDFAPDYVITGEGAFDKQSLMNKGADVVINFFRLLNIPIFLVCGRIDKELLKSYGKFVIPIELKSFFNNERESIENFRKGLELASERIVNCIKAN